MGIRSVEEGDPVALENAVARGPVILVCEHASRVLPKSLGTLGLSEEALASHIAWDPGALAVSRLMAESLDATLLFQRFSRLVYDCNRPPESPAAMPEKSEVFDVPGNAGLDRAARDARTEALYLPFRDKLSALVKARIAEGRPPVIVTMHSFTPVYHGKTRPWHAGVLYGDAKEFGRALIAALEKETGLTIGDNEPYNIHPDEDYTVPVHADTRQLPGLLIEVRHDLIETRETVEQWGRWLTASLLRAAR